jgi:hypothetical protein
MTLAPDFHPRAASAALARFLADGDLASAEALAEHLEPDQRRRLIRACADLAYLVCSHLCYSIRQMGHVAEAHAPDPVIALAIAETAVNVEGLRMRFDCEDGSPAPTFTRVLEHQLLEHPDGDDDHDDYGGDQPEYACLRCGATDGDLEPVYVCPACLDLAKG